MLTAFPAWLATAPPAAAFDVTHTRIVSATPAPWTPDVLDEPGAVHSLAEVGTRIVAGGEFSQVENHGSTTVLTRHNVFAFDKTTGAVDATFVPTTDGLVRSVVVDSTGTRLFIGGEFHNVDGQSLVSLAKLKLTDGSLDTTFHVPAMNGRVFVMRLAGSWLYVGGTFSLIGGQAITGLARLNASTGAVDPTFHADLTGVNNGGTTMVQALDISPDGSHLVIAGNFMQAGGVDRPQVALFNLGSTLSLADWETERFRRTCAPDYNTYLHDVEFSPDGSYFVTVTTGGAFSGGDQTVGCDSAARWETSATGSALQPTWINFTGNDTFWSTAITGTAVYVGGHNRWVNNSYANDRPGAGAYYVSGLAALDPRTGVPFDWVPTRTTGVGVFDLLATSTGLWVGHDTDWIGHAFHYKLAFFPLAGGTVVPNPATATVPGTIYQLGQSSSSAPDDVLYRVNAGGPQVSAVDAGPPWASDTAAAPSPYHDGATTAETWSHNVSISGLVPSSTPSEVFRSDRRGTSATSEMAWHFPVQAGTPVEVRLYFANQDSATSHVGDRDADISVDNRYMTWGLRTTPYDIVQDTGNQVGTMHSYDETSDGTVDIVFHHHISDPIVSAIEIVAICGARASTSPTADTVVSRTFNGSSVGSAKSVASAGTTWSRLRGAYLLGGTLYTGWADGRLCAQSFNGTAFGEMRPVNLGWAGVLNRFAGELPTVTAMFFTSNRVYYTKKGGTQLFFRYFSPEDDMVGAQSFGAQSSGGGIDFTKVNGMFLSPDPAGGGKTFLYYTVTDSGGLHRIEWNGSATVPFTTATISTPGVTWQQQGLVLGPSSPPPNQPPQASWTADCTGLDCAFNSAGSDDPDGTIATYAWNFGDGDTSTQPNPTHHYAGTGTYTVTLTVTDNSGAPDSDAHGLSVTKTNAPPTAVISVHCSGLSCNADGTGSSDPDGTVDTYSWDFGDGTPADNAAQTTHKYAHSGTYTITLTVTDNGGSTDSTTDSVTVGGAATAPDPPTNVRAVAGDGRATVTWDAPVNDNGSPVSSYTVTPHPACAGCAGTTSGGTRTVVSGLTNGTAYTFTVTASNASGPSAPSGSSRIVTPLSGVQTFAGDFNGDGKSDFAVFRPSTGYWYIYGVRSLLFGKKGDVPVPGDYNHDGRTDIAVFRPSTGYWYVFGHGSLHFGQNGDVPVPGDYDGNGTTDKAVFRPSNGHWYVFAQRSLLYGQAGDIPVPADYIGSKATDFAVFRPSNGHWYVLGQAGSEFGTDGDVPVPGNYDGTGKAQIAVARVSSTGDLVWYVKGHSSVVYGNSGDVPMPGRFTLWNRDDFAVFRPSTGDWFVQGRAAFRYGQNGDLPA